MIARTRRHLALLVGVALLASVAIGGPLGVFAGPAHHTSQPEHGR